MRQKEKVSPELVEFAHGFVKGMSVADVFNSKSAANLLQRKLDAKELDPFQGQVIVTTIALTERELEGFSVSPTLQTTVGELYDKFATAKTNYIIVHRMIAMLHDAMITVYDLLDDAKRLRFTPKKKQLEAEKIFSGYTETIRKSTERSAWFLLQDHLRITADVLRPYVEKLFEAIRNKMIHDGWRDVEMLARIEVVMIMARVVKYTHKAFFKDFYDDCGADFSKEFKYAEMDGMVRKFVEMCEALGYRFAENDKGDKDVNRFDYTKGIRCVWAWNEYIEAVRNDDLMDLAAMNAINLNPAAQEKYRELTENTENARMEQSIEQLSGKFKVVKSKH